MKMRRHKLARWARDRRLYAGWRIGPPRIGPAFRCPYGSKINLTTVLRAGAVLRHKITIARASPTS